ncbi:glucuronate isomerase [Weissella koreensis]|uniref:Uronate isomerase n=1 Tax=Weissella koreensis TaxID=165096 RepID=A0A7H1MMA9_9LACO|nr:glucuronate isomerase [Weissella koreensis]AVH75390.1 glucuronate isomerase [Weissella koreensis]EJF34367.1 glucuronate isomerase [Weissella koreensis KCTC 3621]QGN20616.1 glucuronate isomerase [Weissella koreensis]QNT64595.1 glucuronate isomerase [Weissella koreensis]
MNLLDDDFLLENKMAINLYHKYAENMPIIDYHCHLNPNEIYENKNFENITKLWLNDGTYGDHYKWRLMRANGVPEKLVTGDGADYDKFIAWAGTIEKALGNPLYEWTHLELRRFFHIDEQLTVESAPRIWKKANELLATDAFKPRNLIKNSNVKLVTTTDDPISDLHYHELIANDEAENGFKVLPAMRPDGLIQIFKPTFGEYLQKLGASVDFEINTIEDIVRAMRIKFDFFKLHGGKLSDHSLLQYKYVEASDSEVNEIIAKAMQNEVITADEENAYLTKLLLELMKLNTEYGWVMQFHINSKRDLDLGMYNKIGPDTGYDMIGTQADIVEGMRQLFTKAQTENAIPKTILYSLNPNDWMQLATMMQSFQSNDNGDKNRIQLGAAWWFNDTAEGMEEQLRVFAQQSLLPNFIGMLTDSRSFLSYPRHEYFRRVLSNYLGKLATTGRIPYDEELLGQVVKDISYNNAYDYFKFFE